MNVGQRTLQFLQGAEGQARELVTNLRAEMGLKEEDSQGVKRGRRGGRAGGWCELDEGRPRRRVLLRARHKALLQPAAVVPSSTDL